MSHNFKYLEKEAKPANHKNKLPKLILIASYLVIWAIVLISFWFFTDGSDALGFSLLYLWGLLPVTTFLISIVIGLNNYWGKGKWIFSIVFGVMYMLAEYTTFSTANMIAVNKLNLPAFEMIPLGTIISLIGLGIGSILYRFKKLE